jgi:glycosyltransferase involved in cell wall biosynthesis
MRIRVVDPPAYTPPYDHALSTALAAAGNDVELVTSPFRYGDRPAPEGYLLREHFYRVRGPLALRIAQHPVDMLRLRRLPAVDVSHFQWLPIQAIDRHLLPRGPVVITAHDVVPREPRPGQLKALSKTYNAVDAVVVHSQHGSGVLTETLDVPAEKVHVIPHGVFDYLTRVPDPRPLPPELAAVDKPVVLQFGLMRPYKGIDVMLEAFTAADPDAELWIVGMPRMPIEPLQKLAGDLGIADRVRWIPRFINDQEIAAYFERADLVALPYRQIDQSGVLFTALAFGKPLLLTRVGGFSEIADRHGAGLAVEPGDLAALARGLTTLLSSAGERQRLSAAAADLSVGEFSWPSVAAKTTALYESLMTRVN